MTSRKQKQIRDLLRNGAGGNRRQPVNGYCSKTAAAVALRAKGLDLDQIAARIGSTRDSVWQLLARYDSRAASDGGK